MKALITLCLFVSSAAHASYHVMCGENWNENDETYENTVLVASSEDDDFSGTNGARWSLIVNGSRIAAGRARARVHGRGTRNLEIRVTRGTGFAELGTQYFISPMYSDSPLLTVETVGGIAGGTVRGEYECVTTQN